MSNEIMMSVCCLVYNQEKYVRQMIESLVNQKTDFKYEIIINDDASTDGTADILRDYSSKYPELIIPIYQQQNQYSQKIRITNSILYPRVRGKYVCFCEGDDYWCDDNKLQKQFDAMEAHPECSICVHYVQPVNEDDTIIKLLIPNKRIPTGVVECGQYAKWLLAEAECSFQLSSYCIKGDLIHRMEVDKLPEFFRESPVGDEAIQRFCLNYGKLFFIDKIMSCYRANSIGSWNIRENKAIEKKKIHCERMQNMDRLYDSFSNGKFSEYIEQGYIKREFNFYYESCQYSKLFMKKYKHIFHDMKLKSKIKIVILTVFPFTKNILNYIKGFK